MYFFLLVKKFESHKLGKALTMRSLIFSTITILLMSFSALAQNSLWWVVMTKGTYKQSYKKSATWPSSWVSDKLSEEQYITDITYGDGIWAIVVGKGEDYNAQKVHRSATFPSDWVSDRWDEDYNLDHVAYGDDEWVVVMHKGSKLYAESWATRDTWDSMREFIKEKWGDDKDITSLEFGNGVWHAVLAKGTGFKTQSYKWNESYPSEWIKEKFDDDYNITDVAYGKGQWVVVMSKYESQIRQKSATRKEFPATYISENWDDDLRITSLQYNWEERTTLTFDEYYQLGQSAYNAGNQTEAIEYYEKALEIKPNDMSALNSIAWSKYLDGQCYGALNDVKKSVRNGGGSFGYIMHTQGAVHSCLEMYDEAIADFTEAIRLSPAASYYADRGRAKAGKGQYRAAIKDYDEAIKLNPDNIDEIFEWRMEAINKSN